MLYKNLHLIHVGCSHARRRPRFGSHDAAHRSLTGPTHLPSNFVLLLATCAADSILVLLRLKSEVAAAEVGRSPSERGEINIWNRRKKSGLSQIPRGSPSETRVCYTRCESSSPRRRNEPLGYYFTIRHNVWTHSRLLTWASLGWNSTVTCCNIL